MSRLPRGILKVLTNMASIQTSTRLSIIHAGASAWNIALANLVRGRRLCSMATPIKSAACIREWIYDGISEVNRLKSKHPTPTKVWTKDEGYAVHQDCAF